MNFRRSSWARERSPDLPGVTDVLRPGATGVVAQVRQAFVVRQALPWATPVSTAVTRRQQRQSHLSEQRLSHLPTPGRVQRLGAVVGPASSSPPPIFSFQPPPPILCLSNAHALSPAPPVILPPLPPPLTWSLTRLQSLWARGGTPLPPHSSSLGSLLPPPAGLYRLLSHSSFSSSLPSAWI